jgi:hypothetical protein
MTELPFRRLSVDEAASSCDSNPTAQINYPTPAYNLYNKSYFNTKSLLYRSDTEVDVPRVANLGHKSQRFDSNHLPFWKF